MIFWQIVLQYGAAIIVLIFYVSATLHFSHTPDETYVYLQYSKNLARGEGMALNAGSASYGITAPLWAMLIAGGVKLSLDPYIVAKTLDIVFASVSLLAVMALAYVVIRDRLYAIIAALIFSCDAWFLRWAGSGTETSLSILLATLALWYAYKREYIISSLVAGILTLVRPEGVLLFLAAQVDAAVNRQSRMSGIRVAVASCMLYAMVVGTWLGFSYMYFGALFPNQIRDFSFDRSFWSIVPANLWTAIRVVGSAQFVLLIFLGAGFYVTVRKFGWSVVREDGFPLVWALVVLTGQVVFSKALGSRQVLLILPVIVIYGLWGVKRIEVADLISPRRALAMLLLVAGIALAQNQIVYQIWLVPRMENLELGVSECLKPVAYWLRGNTPPGATVLTPMPGVIGYVSDRTVYDAQGAITPQLSHVFEENGYDSEMLEKKYESVVHPDYVLDSSPTPERLSSETLRPVMTRTFPGSGLTKPDLTYFTLYKVTR